MEQLVFPSQRASKPPALSTISPGLGSLGIPKAYEALSNPHVAWQNALQIHTVPRQLSDAAVIPSAAPFKLAIRNASYNLNADPRLLRFTPRTGLLPRIVGVENSDECPISAGVEGECSEG